MLDDANAENDRGIRLIAEGKADEALACFGRAIRLNPKNAGFYANVSQALTQKGRVEEAAALRQGIRIDPGLPLLHNSLSIVLFKLAMIDEAVDAAAEAVRLDPARAQYRFTFGRAIEAAGDLDGADREFHEALRLNPEFDRPADSRAFIANFMPSLDAPRILDVCTDWATRFEHPQASHAAHNNNPDPQRGLKIGYVSSMFYNHAEAFFVLPLLEAHDRERFEIHCFSNGPTRDAITDRHRRAVDGWHEIRDMDDDHAASLIRGQQIDVLVDLAMHLANNRLRLFTRKPAPIQMTWLAYPGTTGLRSIDYRITDPIIDRPGMPEFYSEQSLRLPNSWICYDPLSAEPPRQASSRKFLAFGSFNNPFKINDPLVRRWGRVLQRVPESRLAMFSESARQRARIRDLLGEMGISRDRVGFSPRSDRHHYLRLFDQIDIALDTLPYNGITTSCDALWMGVPVVTMKGNTAPGRAGASLLTAAGLPELIAETEDQFVEIAVALAGDAGRRNDYHAKLRGQITSSALMDRKRFAGEMENAYRFAWGVWCQGIHRNS